MESIKGDPKVDGLVRDLRGTIERLQEKVKVLEDRLGSIESGATFAFGPYFALPRLSSTQVEGQIENGNMLYNTTDHKVWVKINGVIHFLNTTLV